MPDVARIGRYEVLSHLASGGMGSVYLARTMGPGGFERHVVLKLLESNVDDTAIAMFLDEARVIGLMHHQHITPAHELDRDAQGRLFLAMDYVHGQSARAVWLRTVDLGLTLPVSFAVTVGIAAASALRYAHSLKTREGKPLNIVHRDVSLSNLMIGYDGAIKLIDFGIAKMEEQTSISQVGELKGTASYMAPEQCQGDPVDHRTDIYALGVVLYELVTMKRAFREGTEEETIEQVLRGQVVPPSKIVETCPRELERIILTALARNPKDRFQDASELQRELEAFARQHSILVGNSAIVPVMEVLFEDREEPWRVQSDGVPEEALEELTVPEEQQLPTPQLVERRAPSRPRPAVTTPLRPVPRVPAPSARPAAPPPVPAPPPRVIISPRNRPSGSPPPLPSSAPPPRQPIPPPTHDDLDVPTTPLEELRIHDEVITQPVAKQSVELPFSIISPVMVPELPVPVIRAPEQYPLGSSSFDAVEPRSRPIWKWLLVVVLGGAACVIGTLLSQSEEPATPSQPPPAPATEPTPGSAEPARPVVTPIEVEPPKPAPTTDVWLRVTTTPADATVILDGQRLGRTPLAARLPSASGKHLIKIRRRGYIPLFFEVDLSRDVTRDVALRALRVTPRAEPPRSEPPPADGPLAEPPPSGPQ